MSSSSSSSSPTSSYTEQNAMAIELLRAGNPEACARALESGIKHAQAACRRQQQEHPSNQCSSLPYKMSIVRLENQTFNELNARNQEASTDFDPFQGLFTLQENNNKAPSTTSSEMCNEVTVVDRVEILILLYNFAFAMQVMGDTTSLSKALRIYGLAFECAKSVPLHEHPELNTLILAIAANQGFIHSLFFQQQNVKMAHDTIQYLLSVFPPQSLQPEDAYFFEYVAFTSKFAFDKLPPAA